MRLPDGNHAIVITQYLLLRKEILENWYCATSRPFPHRTVRLPDGMAECQLLLSLSVHLSFWRKVRMPGCLCVLVRDFQYLQEPRV